MWCLLSIRVKYHARGKRKKKEGNWADRPVRFLGGTGLEVSSSTQMKCGSAKG